MGRVEVGAWMGVLFGDGTDASFNKSLCDTDIRRM